MELLLKETIKKEDERELILDTNDFLRPGLKEIANSIGGIEKYFSSEGRIKFLPTTLNDPIKEIKDDLSNCLKNTGFFYLVDILTGDRQSTTFEKGFIFLVESLALALDFPISRKHNSVQCDAFILVPHQPVLVLTFIDGEEESIKARMYNSSVAKGVVNTLGRFVGDTNNVIFGTMFLTDLKDMGKFEDKIMSFARRCSLTVTRSSLSMNPQKYERTLTAFCAGLSEIKFSPKGVCDKEDRYIRFLTKEQCLILVENINNRDVKVTSLPDCGGTTLMLEVAARYSRVGKTLLVCMSEEERYRFRSVTSATIAAQQICKTDIYQYDHIIDGTGKLDCRSHEPRWRFIRHRDEIGGDIEEEIVSFEQTMTAGAIKMSLSEGIYHLLNTVTDAELARKRQDISSQTAWNNFLIKGLWILQKRKNYREKLIQVLNSYHRQKKVDHLFAELSTLKLLETWITRQNELFSTVVALNVPTKKTSLLSDGDENEDFETEPSQHSKMFHDLQKGLQDQKDMFTVLIKAVGENNKKLHYLQTKAEYLSKEMPSESGIGIWMPNRGQVQPSTRSENEPSSVEKMPNKLTNKVPVGQMEHYEVGSTNVAPTLDEEFQAKMIITKHSVPNIQEMKETLLQLKKDVDSQEVKLSEHSARDRNEWKYKLEYLSKEIPLLSMDSMITEVIGEDVIPTFAEQSQKEDILKDPATITNDQRRGWGNRVHQLRQFQYGKLTQRNIIETLDNVLREKMEALFCTQNSTTDLERAYNTRLYIIPECGSYRSRPVSCPVMKLDKSRVNTMHHHVSTDRRTLDNRLDSDQCYTDSGQYNTDRFRWYCGTFSSPPIPLPPSPSTLTTPRYWESHSRLSWTARMYERTILEMGVSCVEDVDKEIWLHKHTRSSWCVRLVWCDTHRHSYCTQVWGEGRQVGECYNTKDIPHKTTVVYKYGVVLDVERGRIVFLDVDRDIVIEKMDVRITQTLIAMFGVTPGFLSTWDIEMRLVSGGEIDITDNKQSLIYKALSM